MSDQDGTVTPKRPNLRMSFGADMNEPAPPPPAPLPPPGEPANTDSAPERTR
ncbi:MAG: hypothetical protein AVDCRST_MAG15-1024 [uncultured Rubellimicrobium sp.]|uniref:Uncharacterized protein n=1 Tax=uncultured Rubellimicrobium sp. TaxID=543078 RepID=A0A6J4N9V4_9RHOB|nr:MAG: hypothetical protein AVDCRST_MAG15-1024 [uncultured Rubellimicrobium sp.]